MTNSFRRKVATAAAATLGVCAIGARGQSIGYLRPEAYQSRAGEPLKLSFYEGGLRGVQAAWPSAGVDWLFVLTGGTQENRHNVKPDRAEDKSATVTLTAAVTTMIGTDRKSPVKSLSSAEFEELAKISNIPAAAKEAAVEKTKDPKATVRVEYVDSSKTLVSVTGGPAKAGGRTAGQGDEASGSSAVAMAKSGPAAEARLFFDPLHAPLGSDIPFCVYVDGDKQPWFKVQVSSAETGRTEELISDASGSRPRSSAIDCSRISMSRRSCTSRSGGDPGRRSSCVAKFRRTVSAMRSCGPLSWRLLRIWLSTILMTGS